MFQFREEDTALQAAKVLAVYERTPVLVMTRGFLNVFSIGPWNSPAIHQAGQHMATVHSTGHVERHGMGM